MVTDAILGFTCTAWPNEQEGELHFPAPNVTGSGLMRFLKLIGLRKSSSHMTRSHLPLGYPHPRGSVGVAPLLVPRRRKLVEGVVDANLNYDIITVAMYV